MININMPSVEGPKGTKPTLTFPGPEAPEGLQVQVLDAGDGQVVEAGDTIVANYLGQIWGGDVFDNSYDRGQPLNFQVGVGMVIRGWDDALVGSAWARASCCPSPPSSATATAASRRPVSGAATPSSSSRRSSASSEPGSPVHWSARSYGRRRRRTSGVRPGALRYERALARGDSARR